MRYRRNASHTTILLIQDFIFRTLRQNASPFAAAPWRYRREKAKTSRPSAVRSAKFHEICPNPSGLRSLTQNSTLQSPAKSSYRKIKINSLQSFFFVTLYKTTEQRGSNEKNSHPPSCPIHLRLFHRLQIG